MFLLFWLHDVDLNLHGLWVNTKPYEFILGANNQENKK